MYKQTVSSPLPLPPPPPPHNLSHGYYWWWWWWWRWLADPYYQPNALLLSARCCCCVLFVLFIFSLSLALSISPIIVGHKANRIAIILCSHNNFMCGGECIKFSINLFVELHYQRFAHSTFL